MDSLPLPVLVYISTSIIGPRRPAYLHVDRKHCLVDWGGELTAYGMTALQYGQVIGEQLVFLEGLLPMDTSALCLPWVEIQPGMYADIHLFSCQTGVWILLLDTTPEATQHALMQQKVNDMRLDEEKRHRDTSARLCRSSCTQA